MTARLKELQLVDDGYTVTVKPEVVVEVAYNEIQRSPQYSSGFALRFARITRIRDDKSPEQSTPSPSFNLFTTDNSSPRAGEKNRRLRCRHRWSTFNARHQARRSANAVRCRLHAVVGLATLPVSGRIGWFAGILDLNERSAKHRAVTHQDR